MLSCSLWFSAPIFFWICGGLERLVPHGTTRTVHTTCASALKTATHPKLGAENHMLQLNI
jgi:hypothetical protein